MADITKADVIEFIANMSVLELSELVKEMEEKAADVSVIRPLIEQLLIDETNNLTFDIDELRERLKKRIEERNEADAESRPAITQEIKDGITSLNSMIGALFNNSKRKEALGLKTGDDLQQLERGRRARRRTGSPIRPVRRSGRDGRRHGGGDQDRQQADVLFNDFM